MKLEGSCHCRKVRFSLNSETYVPYQRCYCSICRKVQGGGGYTINIGGEAETLKIKGKGKDFISSYTPKGLTSKRSFCQSCGSALWLWSPEWPELIHPFASAIDTPLPIPPENTHLMLDFKAPWVLIQKGEKDKTFKRYPKESLSQWHERQTYRQNL